MDNGTWTIKISTKLKNSISEFPEHIRLKFLALFKDLEANGYSQPGWPNYSKLGTDKYHCHVQKGRPTYVVCWRTLNKNNKTLEVYYAGTHEKAPY